ncbi:MAG TPA: hypothetical protein VD902_21440 [Symbiobacteriaceae bacterium]|nr:hypothetical protein [Symbiobacteriaceae bacterium]
MPSNKIGGLKAGQGVRRIQAQREGGWRDEDAKRSFEVGAEFRPERANIDMPSRSSRWSGQNR